MVGRELVHACTDVVTEPVRPVEVEQVPTWRLTPLREAVGTDGWTAAGLADEQAIEAVFARFAEPLDPPEWMARATPAARRSVVSAAAVVLTRADGHGAEVGVAVHPAYRRRGHGRQVAGAATAYAVGVHGHAHWRCRVDDPAGLALASRLGYLTGP